jgi:hypothetical protein
MLHGEQNTYHAHQAARDCPECMLCHACIQLAYMDMLILWAAEHRPDAFVSCSWILAACRCPDPCTMHAYHDTRPTAPSSSLLTPHRFMLDDQAVVCGCSPCTNGDRPIGENLISPTEFERHAGLGATRKWRHSIKVTPGQPGRSEGAAIISIG